MNSDERCFPLLRPLKSLADFCERLLNSQSFNAAIRLRRQGVIYHQDHRRQACNTAFMCAPMIRRARPAAAAHAPARCHASTCHVECLQAPALKNSWRHCPRPLLRSVIPRTLREAEGTKDPRLHLPGFGWNPSLPECRTGHPPHRLMFDGCSCANPRFDNRGKRREDR